MLPRLLTAVQLVGAVSTNATTSGCLSCDTTPFDHRSVSSLLLGCALTLLICVWHAIHPALPLPHFKRIHVVLYQLSLMLLALFTPELLITNAFDEWREAKRITKCVQERGYKWWTMTHSHFVLIGGFALRDDTETKEINIHKFLSLVDGGDIANPVITEDDIKDKSASNGIGKAILVVQLSWFTTQIVLRLMNHLAVTLVELDTACMALLTLPLIFFWWEKPRCPERPHIFYLREVHEPHQLEKRGKDPKKKKTLDNSTIKTYRSWQDLLAPADIHSNSDILFLLTWSVSGALHAIAWNYEFPTEIEKTVWRASSLILAGTPVLFGALLSATDVHTLPAAKLNVIHRMLQVVQMLLLVTDVISRVLLVVLMLASLRALPSSAHQMTPWTKYVPLFH